MIPLFLVDTISIAQSYLASRRSATDAVHTSPTVIPCKSRYCRIRMPKEACTRPLIDTLISKLEAVEVCSGSLVHSWAWSVLPLVDKPAACRERTPAASSALDNSFTSAASVLRSSSEWRHVRAAHSPAWDLHLSTSADKFN